MKSFFQRFTSYESQRMTLVEQVPDGPLRDFLSVPFPEPKTRLDELEIVSVDFETTGLNPAKDKLLSVGMVHIDKMQIPLNTAYHQVIRVAEDLQEANVIIHQITDDDRDAGASLETVVETLLKRLAGKVMLAHFHRIEQAFLIQACQQLYGASVVFPVIDTFLIQKKQWDKGLTAYEPEKLRLPNLRAHYQLPHHNAHHALADALATAEVFLAQKELYQFNKLKDVLT